MAILGLGKRKEEDQVKRMVDEQVKGDVKTYEATASDLAREPAIEYFFMEEERLWAWVDSENRYKSLVETVAPLFLRGNYLTNNSEKDAQAYKLHVTTEITRLKNMTRQGRDYIFLNCLKAYLHNRANCSINGFLIKALTEKKRAIVWREEEMKKKGLFG